MCQKYVGACRLKFVMVKNLEYGDLVEKVETCWVSSKHRSSEMLLEKGLIEPANFIERRPELASLVDVDLARLLCVRLTELFTNT